LEVWRTMASRRREVVFRSSFSVFFSVFFGMLRRRLRLEVKIRFASLYPRSGGASSVAGERVESYVRRISQDLAVFRVCLCFFILVFFNLRLSLMTMFAALVRWSFVALAR
jgi:hypothetical protein